MDSKQYNKICTVCGADNEIAHKRCIKCGSYLLEGLQSGTINIDKRSIEKVKRLSMVPDVTCPTCGTRNKASVNNCTKCGAWLVDEYWKAHRAKGTQKQVSKPATNKKDNQPSVSISSYLWIVLILFFIFWLRS